MTSKQLKTLRRKYKLTQAQVAAKTGISIRTIQEHEQGRRNIGRLTGPLYARLFEKLKKRGAC